MALEVCVLGSGSRGNCTYVSSGETSILIDAGLSCRQIARRLEQIGVGMDRLAAVCLSHEHADHITGLATLHKRYGLPLFANRGTVEALIYSDRFADLRWNVFSTGATFHIGDLAVHPFSLPHDAYEPVGFRISCEGTSVTVATDVGMPTTLLREHLRQSSLVVIESNHDEQLLRDSSRPPSLIQRILGRQGHLSNEAAGALLAEVAHPGLSCVFLAHLSEECNRPELAVASVRHALEKAGHAHVEVHCTFPDRPSVRRSVSTCLTALPERQ